VLDGEALRGQPQRGLPAGEGFLAVDPPECLKRAYPRESSIRTNLAEKNARPSSSSRWRTPETKPATDAPNSVGGRISS
jgi:hypothetical protein